MSIRYELYPHSNITNRRHYSRPAFCLQCDASTEVSNVNVSGKKMIALCGDRTRNFQLKRLTLCQLS